MLNAYLNLNVAIFFLLNVNLSRRARHYFGSAHMVVFCPANRGHSEYDYAQQRYPAECSLIHVSSSFWKTRLAQTETHICAVMHSTLCRTPLWTHSSGALPVTVACTSEAGVELYPLPCPNLPAS